MPMLNCYIDDRTLAALERFSIETGRSITDLAEAAISNAAIDAEVRRNVRTQELWEEPAQ